MAVLGTWCFNRKLTLAAKNLGSDIALLVFQRLKRDRALTGNTMKLFMHCSLPRVDLSDYSNATREFLDSVASMSLAVRL